MSAITALRQNRCPTVAQTAAKRTIRTDLPSARQPKKKYRIFSEPGMRNGNKPQVQMSRVFTSLPEKDTRLIIFDLEAQDARQSYAATWDSKSDPLSLK